MYGLLSSGSCPAEFLPTLLLIVNCYRELLWPRCFITAIVALRHPPYNITNRNQ
ncbi:rCG59102 [Rattus norvegicus]|uniref:RCG59102 n=1 Tax=Rattus norvegicus TaxID=10116 RepID=A6JPU9_RAT|nr:rCG59102 [Rattus norvegicus]